MPLSAHAWTALCRACDLVIGTVEDGRFVHDPACTRPLAIGAGTLRCCHCGGHLTADARPIARPAREERPAPAVLRFASPDLAEGEARQRL
jgi:hypothetical protein